MSVLKSAQSLITVSISFLYLIFVLNPTQVISSFLYPFSPNTVRKINRWCARSIWGIWVILSEAQNKVKVRFTGDAPVWKENSFVILNHQSSLDILVLLSFAWRCGRLGDMKWFVKDIIKYIPGIGWGMLFLDCVFVKRNWTKDSKLIKKLFNKYRDNNIPLFLVNFLEGTRATSSKMEKSQEYARKNNLYIPQETLVPRTKGFIAATSALQEHLDAVYDVTLGYPQTPLPNLFTCFSARVSQYNIHVRRYSISKIPKDEDKLHAWVLARFEEKDKLMIEHRQTGCFPGPANEFAIPAKDWLTPEDKRKRAKFFEYQ